MQGKFLHKNAKLTAQDSRILDPHKGERVYFRESSAQENLQSRYKVVLAHKMNTDTPGHSVTVNGDSETA